MGKQIHLPLYFFYISNVIWALPLIILMKKINCLKKVQKQLIREWEKMHGHLTHFSMQASELIVSGHILFYAGSMKLHNSLSTA